MTIVHAIGTFLVVFVFTCWVLHIGINKNKDSWGDTTINPVYREFSMIRIGGALVFSLGITLLGV